MFGAQLTYFAKWPAWAARLVLGGMVALVVLAAVLKPVPRFALLEPPHVSDEMLYRDITQRVMRGENYYAAEADEMRARWYPMGPAVNRAYIAMCCVRCECGEQ